MCPPERGGPGEGQRRRGEGRQVDVSIMQLVLQPGLVDREGEPVLPPLPALLGYRGRGSRMEAVAFALRERREGGV